MTVLQAHFSHAVHLTMLSKVPDLEVWMAGGNVNKSEREDYIEVMGRVPESIHFGHHGDPDVVLNGDDTDVRVTNNRGVTPRRGEFTVYTTETKLAKDPPPTEAWMLIRKGIDTEEFDGWRGDPMADVVMTVNNIENRPRAGDVDLHHALQESDLPYRAYGRFNPEGFIGRPDYVAMLEYAGIYAHLSKTISPNGLYEAMSVGLPVVTIPGYANTDAITHGYNGLVAGSTEQFLAHVEALRSNPDLAKRLGANARRTVLGRYSEPEFVRRWSIVIDTIQS